MFNNNYNKNPFLKIHKGDDGMYSSFTGAFPPHCIQCHSGSSFIPEIENFFRGIIDNDPSDKIEIIFKGIRHEIDSFSAVCKTNIDRYASNTRDYSTMCDGSSCSNITGGYILPRTEITKKAKSAYINNSYLFNDILSAENSQHLSEQNWKDWVGDYNIEVCGLAGDYCVRDTIVALSELKNNNKIILLQDLTRYAYLPLFTTAFLPEHKSQDIYTKYQSEEPKIDFDISKIKSDDKKTINYYIFNNGSLLSKEELDKIQESSFSEPNNYSHFITSHESILDDYINDKHNVKILMDETNYSVRDP